MGFGPTISAFERPQTYALDRAATGTGFRWFMLYNYITIHGEKHKNAFYLYRNIPCRSQWPRGLRRRSSAARLLSSWVPIPPEAWMFVCCECCVLSGRGLCDELITRPEESYRLWRVVVCDLETSRLRRPWPALGRSATEKKNIYIPYRLYLGFHWGNFSAISCLTPYRLSLPTIKVCLRSVNNQGHVTGGNKVPSRLCLVFHWRYFPAMSCRSPLHTFVTSIADLVAIGQ